MSIQSYERRKASQHVKEHRNSAEAVVLRRDTGAIARSTSDGTLTRTTTDTPVNAIIESYTNYEIVASQNQNASTAIQPTDVRAKIAQLDIAGITPTPQDRVVREDGSICNVHNVGADKHSAWWYLQLRRP